MRRAIWIGLFVLLGLALVGAAGVYYLAFAPNTTSYDGERGIKVPRGASFEAVLDSLEARDIVASRSTLAFFGRVTGWQDQVKAGYFTFESGTSNYDLLSTIRRGLQSPVHLTIPPGSRPEVVAAVAGSVMEFEADAFLTALRDTSLAAELDTDVAHLFGYMLPETYFFYWLTDARTVVSKIKEQFDNFYQAEIATQADTIGLSKPEIVTMASIVEWETGIGDEKPTVAGVYLNRLRRGMPLQADPTVQFAVLEQEGRKRRLLYADYGIAHPYNTYQFRGLPPGPITNPSSSSIRAVARAEDHEYYYFVATGDGGHTFSRTLSEHNRAARQYHDLMRQRRREQARQQEAQD